MKGKWCVGIARANIMLLYLHRGHGARANREGAQSDNREIMFDLLIVLFFAFLTKVVFLSKMP